MLLLIACQPKVDSKQHLNSKKDSSPKSKAIKVSQSWEMPVKGVAMVAPPHPFPKDPTEEMKDLGINWVSLQPFGFFRKGKSSIQYNVKGQWWGERQEGIEESTKLAHKNGIKVCLKPQLWTYDQWIGDFELTEEEDWQVWEKNYTDFILFFAKEAARLEIELFCIGTELKRTVAQRPEFWKKLIIEIKKVYQGKLTYAANWDNYAQIPFWKDLDYIGIDAYFPLVEDKTPSVKSLRQAWKPTVDAVETVQKEVEKPVLFMEFGYMSLDACAHRSWELEDKKEQIAKNEQAQANALEALLAVWGEKDWWHGGFQWKWYPNRLGNEGEGDFSKDYTPQGKLATKVLQTFYK